jgi:hypothetical protein
MSASSGTHPAPPSRFSKSLSRIFRKIVLEEFKTVTFPWIVFALFSNLYILILFFGICSQLFSLTLPFADKVDQNQHGNHLFQPNSNTYANIKMTPDYYFNMIYLGLMTLNTHEIVFNQSLGYSNTDMIMNVEIIIPAAQDISDSNCPSFATPDTYSIVIFYDNSLSLQQVLCLFLRSLTICFTALGL